MRTLLALAVMTLATFAACRPPAPIGVNNMSVPKDTTTQCNAICTEIGLPLDSVVVMAENVGCVCRAGGAMPEAAPPGAPPTPPPTASGAASGGAAGGMAAILIQRQAAAVAASQRAAKPK